MTSRSSRGAARGAAVLPVASLAGFAALAFAAPGLAVDLKVDSIAVVQGVQLGSTTLVGDRSAMVRARIGVTGSAGAVADVDARLRVWVDGVELAGSPFFSVNGPISAPTAPNLALLDNTVNFYVVVPQSGDVDFVVDVDPAGAIGESNEANNALTLANQVFACREVVEIVSVSINYTPGGGQPPAGLIEPGVGDGFVRAIYAPRELNYHRSPLPLTWSQNINSSDNTLLNTLKDMLVSGLPGAGFPKPDFIYGWLPGNPYSGNGKSIGIPGEAAFGNSEPIRFQRTFAHELGHLVGLIHTSSNVGTNGIDVEEHLWETEELPQLFPTTKKDVMVAGQLTNAAFVNQASYNKFLGDSRVTCAADAPPDGDGGGNGEDAIGTMLRVSGEIVHAGRTVSLDPFVTFDVHAPTLDDPQGDVLVLALDAAGAPLWQVRVDTQRTREPCEVQEGQPAPTDASAIHVLVPLVTGGEEVAAIELRDVATGALLAVRGRSPNAPVATIVSVGAIDGPAALPTPGAGRPGPVGPAPLVGGVRVAWDGSDPDGDPLSYFLFYSPDDGQRWLPLGVRLTDSAFEFDAALLPATQGGTSKFLLRATDGFQSVDSPIFEAAALGTGSPPDVHLLTPNDGSTFPRHSAVILHASAWDLEDLLLPEESIAWNSSIDGTLGTGRILAVDTLSPGTHLLTVTGTDSDGMSAFKTGSITITPRVVLGPDLNHDGVVDAGDLGMLLADWGTDASDLNGDGIVDGADLGILLGMWS